MAFLVCYSLSPPEDHTNEKAICLDQKLYELIFAHCRAEDSGYHLLGRIANLRYKSPTLVVPNDQLAILQHELTKLTNDGLLHHQIEQFSTVCDVAKSKRVR